MTQAPEALTIRREQLHSPSAQQLIGALNAELNAAYPEPEARHFRLDAEEVAPDKGAFLVGYLNGAPVTCGAIRCIAVGIAEVKRMYVVPAARGRGFSRVLLSALEETARELGMRRLVLETGPRQAEALGLYKRAGYAPIPKFGEYVASELSLCMGKDLQPP
jgi:GNAT superfamily N-acetyltransferase